MDIQTIHKKASLYTKGIVVGGVLGGIFALSTKRSVFFWGLVSAAAGGYIASRFSKVDESQIEEKVSTKFKNYDI